MELQGDPSTLKRKLFKWRWNRVTLTPFPSRIVNETVSFLMLTKERIGRFDCDFMKSIVGQVANKKVNVALNEFFEK